MKKIIIVITLFLLFPLNVSGVEITLKNGNVFKWQSYIEENAQYCTEKSFGKFCIPKSDVASIKEEDDTEGATIITTKGRSEAEKEKDRQKFIADREKAWELQQKANLPACEIISYNTFENVVDRQIVSRPGYVKLDYGAQMDADLFGKLKVEGGDSYLVENKEICITVTVRNNSSSPK